MSRPVANVDVITDSFEIWLLETNELLHALTTEIITANSTYANTGNTAFPRTAQLYGTFGANNLVVTDWVKGGNVNGSFANLMISTNTVLSNTTATEIRLEVANGSSNSFMWQYGLHAGLTGANLVANTTKLTIQSNSTTNTTATAFAVVAANSTNTATMNPISFSTGLFVANTIQITLGANVTANATNGGTIQVTGSGAVGNSVSNSSGLYVGNTVTNSQITSVRFFAAEGSNTVLANNQIISMVNSTSSANIDPISFKTGIFTANTIQISLGANVTANATNGGTIQVIGTSTIGNTVANSTGLHVGNTLNSSQVTSIRFLASEGSNTTLANTRIISIANSIAIANIEPNAFKTGEFTANTIQVSVGANVYATANALFVGNSTFTTVVGNGSITASANLTVIATDYIKIVGAMNVSSNATLASTLSVAGAANVLSTLGVTGAANALSTLGVTGSTALANTLTVVGNTSYSNIVTFKTDHVVDVFANGNLGATTGSDLLMFEYPKADYSTAKLLIQLKNAGNTQISEVLLAHDTSSAQLTTYGTVSSPVSANSGVSLLGIFSANVDTTNVRVYVKQTRASSAAKVVAQFIK